MMIKNIKSILVITLPILLLSCGFKPIHLKNEKLINIQNISIEGESRSAYFLKNGILLISDTDSKKIYDIIIKVTKQKNNKIKNMTGKITRYTLLLTTEIELKNLDNNIKIKKTFARNADYNVGTSHSGTINNEKNATKNITQQLLGDIVNFITLSVRDR